VKLFSLQGTGTLAHLVIFVLAYGIAGLVGLDIAFVLWKYDSQPAAAYASIYAISVGIPLGLASILVFHRCDLKPKAIL
jgi:hypothetical protein